MKIRDKVKPSLPPIPGGTYLGICVYSIALGEQLCEFEGKSKGYYNQVMLGLDLRPDRGNRRQAGTSGAEQDIQCHQGQEEPKKAGYFVESVLISRRCLMQSGSARAIDVPMGGITTRGASITHLTIPIILIILTAPTSNAAPSGTANRSVYSECNDFYQKNQFFSSKRDCKKTKQC